MANNSHAIEVRVKAAVDAYHLRNNAKIRALAREFDVPHGRLRFRLKGMPSASDVRGLHLRALTPAQDEALRRHILSLDSIGCPPRLKMVECAVLEPRKSST